MEVGDTAIAASRARIGRALDYGANIWLFNSNTLVTQIGLAIFNLIFNLHLAELGLREDYIGFFWFANTAALGAFALPAGYICNRLGPRWCLAVSSGVIGVLTAAVGLVVEPVLIVVAGALLGASTALLFVPGGPFMMDNCREDNRLSVFSMSSAVVAVAAVLGSLMSGYLPSLLLSAPALGIADRAAAYRAVLLLAAALCALGVLPMLVVRAAPRRRPASKSAAPVAAFQPLSPAVARRALILLGGSCAVNSVATGLIVPFYNVYLSEHLRVSVENVGLIYAAASLLMVPASLSGPLLTRWLGTIGTVVVPRALIAPFALLPVLVGTPSAAALTYVMRAGLMNASFPTDNSFTMELMPPRMRAMQAGVRTASWNASWAVASLVSGQVIVAFGYPAIFVASAVLHVASAAYYGWAFGPFARRRAPAETGAGSPRRPERAVGRT